MTSTAATAVTRTLPGTASAVLDSLAGRARLHDLYDEVGSAVYDDLCAGDTAEVRELVQLVRPTKGPVLELAAGSGRLTLPLLAAGREVTALELSTGMLRLLTERLDAAPSRLRDNCTTVHGDMRSFALGRKFAAIVLGTTSVSLLDEAGRAGLHAAVVAHLAPGGRFLVSVIDAVTGQAGSGETEFEVTGGSGRAYRMIEHWPYGAAVRTVTILPADPGREGPVDVCVSTVGVLSADRLESEMREAGLVTRARHTLPGGGRSHRDVLLEAEVA